MSVSKRSRSLVPPELMAVLSRLVREPNLPLLDRWFSQQEEAKNGALWEQLRLAVLLSEAYVRTLGPRGSAPLGWEEARQVLRPQLAGWATFVVAVQAKVPSSTEDEPTRWGLPAWLMAEWQRRVTLSEWGDKTSTFWRSQIIPPGLHVRFCGPEASRGLEEWRQAGGSVTEVLKGVWRAQGPRSVFSLEAWKRGSLEIQDAASYEAARLAGARPGQAVWDVCAGRGGKTAVLAEEMAGKGSLW
ncbi:MAG: hypothetical protein HKM05_10555, partial [Spirochaetales bacterium]|nr:hypothetical protein [Spirochaetales bacterium]